MDTKQQIIDKFLAQPIKVGDDVDVLGHSTKDPNRSERVTVVKVDKTKIYYKIYGYTELQSRLITEVVRSTDHLGVYPFTTEIRSDSYQIDIEQLFWRGGYDRRNGNNRMEKYFGIDMPETCLNPTVINEKGEEVEFQRGLVWSLEQKQLLIESIYNHVEIGKFVFRKRKFQWVEKRIKEGKIEHTAFSDLVDGKQRYTTLLEFVEDKFPDLSGRYFSSFSHYAQRKFFSYRQLSYVELDENSTDKDTLAVFLAINFTGVPMSRDHIDYVRSIKI